MSHSALGTAIAWLSRLALVAGGTGLILGVIIMIDQNRTQAEGWSDLGIAVGAVFAIWGGVVLTASIASLALGRRGTRAAGLAAAISGIAGASPLLITRFEVSAGWIAALSPFLLLVVLGLTRLLRGGAPD